MAHIKPTIQNTVPRQVPSNARFFLKYTGISATAGWGFYAAGITLARLVMTESAAQHDNLWARILFPSLFICIGLVTLYTSIKRGSDVIKLLRSGTAMYAQYMKEEHVDTENNQRSYTFTFIYHDAAGKSHLVKTSTRPPEWVNIGDEMLVIYDPDKPYDATLPYAEIGYLIINDRGHIEAQRPVKGYLMSLIPLLAVLLTIGIIISVGCTYLIQPYTAPPARLLPH